MLLAETIRTIPDYPKKGILFRDITTLLGDARAFRRAVDELVQPWAGTKIDKVAGIEARGFILGGAVAHQLSAGFVPIRKKGKLPHATVSIPYSLEYGLDHMEMHEDAVTKGERVILVDDLIATGGTAEGAVKLLRQMGAEVIAACFVIDLPDLGGAAKLEALSVPVRSLVTFRRALEGFGSGLGGRRDLAHLRADEEALLAAVVEREHAAAAGYDVDHDIGVLPGFVLGAADVEGRAADLAHLHVIVADQEVALGVTHGRGAVAASAGLMKHHRSVVGDDFIDQVERRGRCGHSSHVISPISDGGAGTPAPPLT